MYPQHLELLIDLLMKLPGVGEKTAQRYALDLLTWDETTQNQLATILAELNQKIKKCKICNNISEHELCEICVDINRNEQIVCVVESIKDLIAIEKTGHYMGKYNVLNGLISINKGIQPEDLNINNFIQRCVELNVQEVILALNHTIEGETTSLYIAKKLEEKNIPHTKLASGIPMGGNIEYADPLTLLKALEGRK